MKLHILYISCFTIKLSVKNKNISYNMQQYTHIPIVFYIVMVYIILLEI